MVGMNKLMSNAQSTSEEPSARLGSDQYRPCGSPVSVGRFLALVIFACFLLPGVAKAQSYPPVWNNTSNYVAGDMVTDYGNVYRCLKPVTTHYLDPSKTYQDWELYYVRNNTTLVIGVGQTFPTLTAAWTYAQNCHIAEGAYLHLSISTANGNLNEDLGTSINLDQPSGASISIIGDNPNNIDFTSLNGIQLDSGHELAVISGIQLTGTGIGNGITLTGNASIETVNGTNIAACANAISVDQGARIHCTKTVVLNDFETGVSATRQGSVVFDSGATFEGTGNSGTSVALYERNDGYIEAPAANISTCGFGVLAAEGGVVNIEGATFISNNIGIQAIMKAQVEASHATFGTGNMKDVEYDVYCASGATVDAEFSNLQTHTTGVNDGSYIYG